MSLNVTLLQDIETLNPWLSSKQQSLPAMKAYRNRQQQNFLLNTEWDNYCTVLVGPRRAGKTTLGNYLCRQLLDEQRFSNVLYINCDFDAIRHSLTSPSIFIQLIKHYQLEKPIIFIDEIQRLKNPGLLLKALYDLNLPYKWIATGSSQLEIKSQVSEHLTGRAIEALILPLSVTEYPIDTFIEERLLFGVYPSVVNAINKQAILEQLYKQYIDKDIISILKLDKPHIIEKLITLIAHATGQLINYQQLACDCQVSIPTVQSHLQKLELTYVLQKITPFVGNKRTEITTNPKYYFIDNGFRNQALRNFNGLNYREDVGALVEGFVFQELLKFKVQNFYDFDIRFWRTKAKAEVDFVIYKNEDYFCPIEVKYRTLKSPSITRSFRSFLQAYQPKQAFVVNKSLIADVVFENTMVHFVPLYQLDTLLNNLRLFLAL